VTVPRWLTLLVAFVVLGFGSFRIWLGMRKVPPPVEGEAPESAPSRSVFAGGFYRMGKRSHLFVGLIYVLLGAALIATSFGFNPFGNAFGPSTEVPAKDQAPTKDGIKIDTMPAPKK
jgi:hypothetical protein